MKIQLEKKRPEKKTISKYTDLKKILDANCKQGLSFLANNTGIFRGMTGTKDFMVVDYSKGERSSTNTDNFYTVIFDNSPYFKDYPKRSKSMICSNSIAYAENYTGWSEPYAIIPFDGTKIAVCPRQDIWETKIPQTSVFSRSVKNLELIQYSDHFTSGKSGISSETNKLSEIQEKLKQRLNNDQDFRATFKHKNVNEIINDIFNDLHPDTLNFRLMSIPNFSSTFKNSLDKFKTREGGSNECWVSGPCVAIRLNVYLKLIDGYKKMATFKQYIQESFNNWVRYTDQSLADDFAEYKKKEESKWKERSEIIGLKFPIFNSKEEFKQLLDSSDIVKISSLKNVKNLTFNPSIDDIKVMVSSYIKPRDVDRIVDGINNNSKLPLPIILKGSKGMWILAGNTRQSVTRVLGSEPKAILINVEEK